MEWTLTQDEARVLGALIEKEMTTPDYYPLSLNALTNACNQKSNREPVMSLEEAIVRAAVEQLRHKGLAEVITGDRVLKYGHRAYEALNVGRRELSLLCVLLLRGPQTVGELKERTHRMYTFDDLEAVENCLRRMAEHQPSPLVMRIERRAGMREPRYAQLLCGEVAPLEQCGEAAPIGAGSSRLDQLEAEVAALRESLEALQREWQEFRKQFQ